MKERNQTENDLEVERVDTKLRLDDGLQNCPLTSDDVPEKQGLYALQPSPVCLQ